jgi:iron complex outermembrane recepter protein
MKKNLLAAALAASAPVWAQQTLPAIVITGNPLGQADLTTPASVLTGKGLVLRRAGSLAETLDGLPGVGASYFGPIANRPVIRGQDGDRIRVLSNAGASLDASALSFDHAVPIDPLVVERIEVLRGPAALLYGGSAVGGVVNAIDNRIPSAALDGLSGAGEVRLGGAARERSVSALVEGGGGGFALHADAFHRRTDDLRVPAFERPLAGGGSERRTRIVNSASQAHGGALGASRVWAQGHLGLSIDSYRNDYGIVAEEDITIQMRRDKLALAGEWRSPDGFLRSLRGQAARTDYKHQEIEGDGSVGTTFRTRGSDGRLEAVHRAFALGGGRVEGTVGLQFENSSFSALGEEAFVPSTHTRQSALFVLERWSWSEAGHLSLGLRGEQVRVRSEGDAAGSGPQFGPAQERRFKPASASVGSVFKLSPEWQAAASASYTERAPTSYELYANGVHAATGAYERGDPAQRLERGRHLEVSLAWQQDAHRVKVGLFDGRFSNYILLAATGEPDFVDAGGDTFPVFAFSGVRAQLQGLEAEANWRAWSGASTLDVEARLDLVRARNRDSGEALPRQPPLRTTLALNWQSGPWAARAEVQVASAQRRVPATDSATEGWTMVNLAASHTLNLGGQEGLLFAKLQNLRNTLAYSATTTGTLRAAAPLPGRGLSVGLRLAF